MLNSGAHLQHGRTLLVHVWYVYDTCTFGWLALYPRVLTLPVRVTKLQPSSSALVIRGNTEVSVLITPTSNYRSAPGDF